MDEARGRHADGAGPGGLMHLVAVGLADKGFDVRLPDHPEERRLLVSGRDAECSLTVGDWGETELEYSPRSTEDADPVRTADMASVLLASQPRDAGHSKSGHRQGGLTFKGMVGLELRARGMNVALDVCQDEANLDVYAEIVITRPGRPESGQVHVTDAGSLTWRRDQWHADGTVGRKGDHLGEAPGLQVIALDITAAVADAMRQGIPAEPGPAAPSPAS